MIARDTKVAGPTDRVADPLTPPLVALIVVVPACRLVAFPVASTVATLEFEELQVEDAFKNSVVPSLSVASAMNLCDSPAATVAVAGVTCNVVRVDPGLGVEPIRAKLVAPCPAVKGDPFICVNVPLEGSIEYTDIVALVALPAYKNRSVGSTESAELGGIAKGDPEISVRIPLVESTE